MDAVERVEDWLAGMRVDQPLVLTNLQYSDLWALVTLAKAGRAALARLTSSDQPKETAP
jgi:hypothetical protein